MSEHLHDRIVGLVLLACALIWTGIVYKTIPSIGGEVGPRTFPLFFGVTLSILSALMVLGSFSKTSDQDAEDTRSKKPEIIGVVSTFLLIVGYGLTLELVGFVIATPILITLILVFLLGVRRPVFIATFAIGMTAGTYLIFNKLLGAYLPPGTLVSLF